MPIARALGKIVIRATQILMNIQSIYLGSKKIGELFQESLELDDDYVQHILQADDWTMMILSWALIEACLNQAIAESLGKKALNAFVDRLSVAGRIGKVELAYSLGLISKNEKNFINVFSEVRNRFAHSVKRFKTTFDDYFSEVDDLSKYANALPIKDLLEHGASTRTTFTEDKRTLILINVVFLCTKLLKN